MYERVMSLMALEMQCVLNLCDEVQLHLDADAVQHTQCMQHTAQT